MNGTVTREDEVEERTTRRRRSRTDTMDSEEETQLDVEEPKAQTVLPPRRRRRSANDAVDVVVCETQLEEGEPEEQHTPTRRRRPATDSLHDQTQQEDAGSQHTPILDLRSRRQSDSDEDMGASDSESETGAAEPKLQTPTPRKRRRSSTNGVSIGTGTTAGNTTNEAAAHQSNNGLAEASSLAVDSQIHPPDVEVFQVGDLVDVIERQWVGINKRGGAARITKVHGDGFYAVKFLIGTGSTTACQARSSEGRRRTLFQTRHQVVR